MNFRQKIVLNTEDLSDHQAEALYYQIKRDDFKRDPKIKALLTGVISMLDSVDLIEFFNGDTVKYLVNEMTIESINEGFVIGYTQQGIKRYIPLEHGYFYHPSILSALRCL